MATGNNRNHLELAKPFARLFIPVAAIILLVAFYLDSMQAGYKQQALMDNEQLRIAQHAQIIHQTFDHIITDLVILSKHNAFTYIPSASPSNLNTQLQNLASEFKQFHIYNPRYDQIRFLNMNGMEMIRTNRTYTSTGSNVEIISKDKLQNKKNSTYFINSLLLHRQEVYISPIEANTQDKTAPQTIKPTIRFSIPLFDSHGIKFGILTLNYNSEQLLDKLKSNNLQHGQYLTIFTDAHAWSKNFISTNKDEAKQTFKNKHPRLWKDVQTSSSGQSMQADGLFTFSQIHPLASIKKRLDNNTPTQLLYRITPQNYTWLLISHIPTSQIHSIIRPEAKIYFSITALLIAVWFIIAFTLIRHKAAKEQSQQHLIEKDIQMRHIVDTAMNGIITINEHGIIQSFNPAATRMFGYTEHEAIEQNISMLVPSPHKENHDSYIQHYIDTQEARIVGKPREVLGKHKNGQELQVELFVSAKQIGQRWLFIGILHDISERKAMQEKLTTLATTDGLTGIFNRGYFNSKLNEEFKRSKRYPAQALSLMILDADHFKSVNDYYGHPAGDALLIKIAQTAQQCARETDIVARYGGEEFAIIMPNSNAKEALQFAERLRISIESIQIEHSGNIIKRTVSIGIACLQESDSDSDILLSRADRALYYAKEDGRNRSHLS